MPSPFSLRSAGLRTRLTLVAVISLLLGAGLTLLRGASIGREGQERVRGEILRLASLAEGDVRTSILQAQRLFAALAANPALESTGECGRILGRLMGVSIDLTEVGILSGDGTIHCDTDPARVGTSFSGERWFARLMGGAQFVIDRGRAGLRRTDVVVAAPLQFLRPGRARYAIAFLDLETLLRRAVVSTGTEGAAAAVADSELTILTRYPDAARYTGRPALSDSTVQALFQSGGGVIERAGLDSVVRIYAIKPVDLGMGAPLSLSLGVPRESALADVSRHRRETVLSFGAALAVLLIGVWFASDFLLTRPTRALVAAANRLASGDLAARSGTTATGGEIGELGQALDALARSLEERQTSLDAALGQARAAEANATENEARYRKLFELNPAPAVVWDRDNRAVIVNRAMASTFGYSSPDELVGVHADAFVAPEDQEALGRRRVEAARDGVGRAIMWTGIRKDGTRFPMESSSIMLRDSAGTTVGRLSVGHDLSPHRELEQRRQELGQLIEESATEVYLVDPDSHRILDASRGARENLGYSAADIQGLRVSDISPPELAVETMRRFDLLVTGGTSRLEYDCELVRRDGSRYPAHLTVQLAAYDGRPALLAFAVDITERQQRDRELTLSEAKYRTLVEGSTDLVLRLDREGRIEFLNGAARAFADTGVAPVEGRRITDLPAFRDQQGWLGTAVEQVFRTGQMAEADLDMPGRGALACHHARLLPERDPEGAVRSAILTLQDITARRRAELELAESLEELRALSARLDTVREEERAEIAREIHDELGQALTGLKMDTVWLERRLDARPTGDGETGRLARMRELIDDTVRTVRRLATELRPPILDDLGLAAAVLWQAEQFSTRTGIPTDVQAPEGVGASRETNLALFRILQEALTNVVRHAEARRVAIELSRHGSELVLSVRDDGRGFGPGDARAGALGLVGMRERIGRVRGRLEVASARGRGTTIIARVPG